MDTLTRINQTECLHSDDRFNTLPVQAQTEVDRQITHYQEQGFELIDPTELPEELSDVIAIVVPGPSNPELPYQYAGIQVDTYHEGYRVPSRLCEPGVTSIKLSPLGHNRVSFPPEPSFYEPEDPDQVISPYLPATLETTDGISYYYMYHYNRNCRPIDARPTYTASRRNSSAFFLSRV